jgi:hypothetical protein
MALTTRAGKGSKLNSVEMDTNILELSRILSSSDGTGIIQVTGSTIQAPNTSITASYFKGDGSALTNVTASYSPAAGSNTYIQYNNNGILGAEAAFTYNASTNILTVTNIVATDLQIAKAISAADGYLLDGAELTSIDWKNRALKYTGTATAVDWTTDNRLILSSSQMTMKGLANTNQGNIIAIDSTTGRLYYMSTSSIVTTPSSPVNSIQFNSASVFKGDSSFTFNINTFSLSQGQGTTASGNYSHAEGYFTSASGNYSHAEGNTTIATSTGAHAEGTYTRATNSQAHAEGFYTTASGISSHAEGNTTIATGNGAHAEGYLTIASKAGSHAEGWSTDADGICSHAEGYLTYTGGSHSHAEGESTQANGLGSHAEGNISTANGDYSHAEGRDTNSTGDYSHAEGSGTTASGLGSHAEGNSTVAIGDYSHAQGLISISFGDHSFAGGLATIASGSYQTAIGQYNTYNDSTSYFIVGSGTSEGSRKDAFKVTNSSSIIVATQSAAPGWTGKEGEMVPVKNGASYFIYVYIGGAWRSSSLL